MGVTKLCLRRILREGWPEPRRNFVALILRFRRPGPVAYWMSLIQTPLPRVRPKRRPRSTTTQRRTPVG